MVLNNMEFWRQRVGEVMGGELPMAPPPKVKETKYRLPAGQVGKSDPGEAFWEKFPRNRVMDGVAMISHIKLLSLVLALGGLDMEKVKLVCADLEKGADIGCRGPARQGSFSSNAASCERYPEQITEAIGGWLEKGFAAGPFRREEVPEGAKINGIMCRPKPNGAVRVILNMSAPAGSSVNDGIDGEEFPAVMSSTAKWVAVLNRAGRNCLMTKADWSDAYKHIRVREEDRILQWFSWMGRFFVELALVFGTVSSPGIYDRAAKVVLDLVLRLSRFPRDMVCQYLDDVCAAAPPGGRLNEFRLAYQRVAAQIGVRLASEDDPEKAFAPCTRGTVLGIRYDTERWTWEIPAEKLGRLNEQIVSAIGATVLPQREVWSLVGRIVHYCPLVPAGRFNVGHLIGINRKSADKEEMVEVTESVKRQLRFWLVVLNVSSGLATIPPLITWAPAWAREFYTDAAGGSATTVGLGCGGVSRDWWFYVPWGRKINAGVSFEGRRLSSKLSALELVGPLICLAAAPDMVRGRPVRIWVDNIGSVKIWQKGYSGSCALCTSLVSAMASVAAALGTTVVVEKVARCSVPPAVMADALSKGAFGACRAVAREAGWPLRLEPARVPAAILRWVADPSARDLGEDILLEMRRTTLVLGYNC